jgi:hypothetical protein
MFPPFATEASKAFFLGRCRQFHILVVRDEPLVAKPDSHVSAGTGRRLWEWRHKAIPLSKHLPAMDNKP